MRALMLTFLSLVLIAIIGTTYHWFTLSDLPTLTPLNPDLRLIGGIDMDKNEGVTEEGLKEGTDILLVINNRLFMEQFIPSHPEFDPFYNRPFDIAYFNSNKDHIVDSEDPLWPFIYAVVYSPDGTGYRLRSLDQVGIRGIYLEPHGATNRHQAILSDGDRRTVYQFNLSST